MRLSTLFRSLYSTLRQCAEFEDLLDPNKVTNLPYELIRWRQRHKELDNIVQGIIFYEDMAIKLKLGAGSRVVPGRVTWLFGICASFVKTPSGQSGINIFVLNIQAEDSLHG